MNDRQIADELAAGDPTAVNDAIAYLERDPWEFRSGYVKAQLLRRLKHVELSRVQTDRIESALLHYVDVGLRWDFREACTLARRIATPSLSDALRARLSATDVGVRLRALTMLLRLPQPALSPTEASAARELLLEWASTRDDPRFVRPSRSIEWMVRRLWSPEWAQSLQAHASANASDPLRRPARRLLAVAPRRARR